MNNVRSQSPLTEAEHCSRCCCPGTCSESPPMEHTGALPHTPHLHLSLRAHGEENPPGSQRWDAPAPRAAQRRCTHCSAHPRQAPESRRTRGEGQARTAGESGTSRPRPGTGLGQRAVTAQGRPRRHLPCTPALGCGSSAPGSSPRPLPSFIVPRPPRAMAAAAAAPAPAPPATSGPPWPEAARQLPRTPAAAEEPRHRRSVPVRRARRRRRRKGGKRRLSSSCCVTAQRPRRGRARGGRGQTGGRGLALSEGRAESRPGAGLKGVRRGRDGAWPARGKGRSKGRGWFYPQDGDTKSRNCSGRKDPGDRRVRAMSQHHRVN